MGRTKKTFIGLATLGVIGLAFTSEPSLAANFTYPDFNSTNGLILQEHAGPFKGRLRISPAIAGWGYGGVWFDAKQPVKNGFETTFQIQITDKHCSGADGMAFVIQNAAKPALGQTGQGLGYGGVTNQFVVHFDNYHWGDHPTAGRYDEIAVLAAPSPTEPLYNIPANIIASANKQVVYSDGAVHTVRIVYVPGNLQVFLDDLENPLMTVYVNLAKLMNLDDDRAWVGFTAASGMDWQNHDLVSWKFNSSDDATPNPVRISPQPEVSDPTPLPAPVYVAENMQASPTTPLPMDASFGYRLPDDVGLTHQIEASTDLVAWIPLTNASYYFRDQDSTNYPQRFYRFQKN
jgi:Legume lectin domain